MKFVVSLAVLFAFGLAAFACPPAAATCYQQQAQVYSTQTVYQQALIVQPVQAAIIVPVVQAPVQVQTQAVVPQVFAAPPVQYQQAVQFAAVQTYATPYCAAAGAGIGYGTGRSFGVQREVVRHSANVVIERQRLFGARRAAVAVQTGGANVVVRRGLLGRNVIRVR